MSDIEIILSSSMLAALLSAIVSIYINLKRNNLDYITSERREWRNDIKKIAEEIEEADFTNIKKVLVKLKVRINPYGLKYSTSLLDDNHIWNAINNLNEKSNYKCKEEFQKNKDILVKYLCVSLKDNWEISKREVRINTCKIIALTTFLIANIYAIYNIFSNPIEKKIGSSFLIIICNFFLTYFGTFIIKQYILGTYYKENEGLLDKIANYIYYIIILLITMSFLGLNIYLVFKYYNWLSGLHKLDEECSGVCSFLIIIALSAEYIPRLSDIEKRLRYRTLIKIANEGVVEKSIAEKGYCFVVKIIKRLIKIVIEKIKSGKK